MKQVLSVTGSVLAGLLLVLAGVFIWASSGRLPDEDLAQTKQYAAPDTADRDTLTVATYNVGYLSGMTNNKPVVRSESLFAAHMDRALSLLSRPSPDLLGLQEVDYGAARSFYAHQLDTMATRLGYAFAAQAVNWDERYLPFPYGRPAVHFGRVVSGQAVLSNDAFRAHRRSVLPRPPQPFYRAAFYIDRLVQTVLVDVGGRLLVVFNVHLEAYDANTRAKQARVVRVLYEQVAERNVPALVLGDFNAERTNPADATMRHLLNETDLRAARPSGPDTTARATYPADAPTQNIDHILYSPAHMTPVTHDVRCGPSAHPPSDHCLVEASFVFTSRTSPRPVDSVRAALPREGPLSLDALR